MSTASFEYHRLPQWEAPNGNGWTTEVVATRFVAGTTGRHYLEHWPCGPEAVRHAATIELLDVLDRAGLHGGVLIDVGCGNAVIRRVLDRMGRGLAWKYVGLDVNPGNVRSCRQQYPRDVFHVVAESGLTPLPDRCGDVVLASGVLEYFKDPAVALREWARLADSWVLLCRIGVRDDEPEAIYRQVVRHEWGSEQHCFRVFRRAELEGRIRDAGLEVEWTSISEPSGTWSPPDSDTLVSHRTYLLRKRVAD